MPFFLRQVAMRTGWPVSMTPSGDWVLGDIGLAHQAPPGRSRPLIVFPSQPGITGEIFNRLDLDRADASSWLHANGEQVLKADLDLPAITWRLLKRTDESDERHFDKHGRFDQHATDLVVSGLDQAPVLDIVIEQFNQTVAAWSREIGKGLPAAQRPWPPGKKAAVCVTHDVDRLSGRDHLLCGHLYWWAKAAQSALKGRFAQAADWIKFSCFWLRRRNDPLFSFDDWMATEDRAGIRSTFFFLALDRALSREGRRYAANDPRLKEVVQKLIEGGWEVGVHFARRRHVDPHYLSSQREKLSALARLDIRGARHHFLNVSYPKTWEVYARTGICISSNVGYHGGRNGFRAGTCWPYFPEVSGEVPELIEIPYQVIDRKRMQEPHSQEAVFRRYVEHAKRVGGVVVVDYHQEHFSEELWPHVQKSYQAILRAIVDDAELFCATLGQVAALCRAAGLPKGCPAPDRPGLRTGRADTT